MLFVEGPPIGKMKIIIIVFICRYRCLIYSYIEAGRWLTDDPIQGWPASLTMACRLPQYSYILDIDNYLYNDSDDSSNFNTSKGPLSTVDYAVKRYSGQGLDGLL